MNVTGGQPHYMDRPVVAHGFPMTPQEALVQARLDDLHAHVDAAQAAASARIGTTPHGEPVRSLRVRIGHGIVALGAALAGEESRIHDHRPA